MSTTLQFLYEMITTGPEAFNAAENLFRAADNDITKDAIAACDLANNVLPGSPLNGLKNFIKSDPIVREWAWFKRILADMFLIIVVAIGTLLVLYFLG